MTRKAPAWLERLAAIENRMLDWARSPEAVRVAGTAPTGKIDDLRGHKYCVLVSYRKNGEAIPSPLWFGVGEGKIYVHTGGAKIKRIERNPRVLVAPSTFRGRPRGAPLPGTARRLSSPADQGAAEQAIQANYGWTRRLYYRLSGQHDIGVYLEVTPEGPA